MIMENHNMTLAVTLSGATHEGAFQRFYCKVGQSSTKGLLFSIANNGSQFWRHTGNADDDPYTLITDG